MQRSLTAAAQQLICNQQVIGSNPIAGYFIPSDLRRSQKENEKRLCTAYAFIRFHSHRQRSLLTALATARGRRV
jgi:hypothetical protein